MVHFKLDIIFWLIYNLQLTTGKPIVENVQGYMTRSKNLSSAELNLNLKGVIFQYVRSPAHRPKRFCFWKTCFR